MAIQAQTWDQRETGNRRKWHLLIELRLDSRPVPRLREAGNAVRIVETPGLAWKFEEN